MPVVKYVGTSHYRILDAADAKRAEPPVEGFKKTTWARNESHEVSDSVAKWLLRDLSDEFAEVEQNQTDAKAATALAEPAGEPTEASGGGDAPAGKVSKSSSSGSSSKTS